MTNFVKFKYFNWQDFGKQTDEPFSNDDWPGKMEILQETVYFWRLQPHQFTHDRNIGDQSLHILTMISGQDVSYQDCKKPEALFFIFGCQKQEASHIVQSLIKLSSTKLQRITRFKFFKKAFPLFFNDNNQPDNNQHWYYDAHLLVKRCRERLVCHQWQA